MIYLHKDQIYLYNNALDENNVLDYFSKSPFYEKNSINEQCKLQKIDFQKRTGFTGIEFNVEKGSVKDLFIISKSFRKNHKESFVICYFYVFKGTIYQSPDVYSIITNNIESIANNFSDIMQEINHE
jgi:mediator of RNA polymerase II transcription subunit 6